MTEQSPYWFEDLHFGMGIDPHFGSGIPESVWEFFVILIPILVRGSPFWYGDVLIPILVWRSPNRFGDSFEVGHPHFALGIPVLVWGFGDPRFGLGIPKSVRGFI